MPSRNPAAHSFMPDPYGANIVYEDEVDPIRTPAQPQQSQTTDPYGANIVEFDGQLPEAPRQGRERGRFLSAINTASKFFPGIGVGGGVGVVDAVDAAESMAEGAEAFGRGLIGGYYGTQASVTANNYRKHQAIKDDIMQGRTVRASDLPYGSERFMLPEDSGLTDRDPILRFDDLSRLEELDQEILRDYSALKETAEGWMNSPPGLGEALVEGRTAEWFGSTIGSGAAGTGRIMLHGLAGTFAGARFGAPFGLSKITGPAAGMAASFRAGLEQYGGDLYMDLRELGLEHGEAQDLSLTFGAGASAVSLIVPSIANKRILEALGGQRAVQQSMRKLTQSVTAAGGTEGTAELVAENLIMTAETLGGAEIPWEERLERSVTAATAGFTLGAGMGAAPEFAARLRRELTKNRSDIEITPDQGIIRQIEQEAAEVAQQQRERLSIPRIQQAPLIIARVNPDSGINIQVNASDYRLGEFSTNDRGEQLYQMINKENPSEVVWTDDINTANRMFDAEGDFEGATQRLGEDIPGSALATPQERMAQQPAQPAPTEPPGPRMEIQDYTIGPEPEVAPQQPDAVATSPALETEQDLTSMTDDQINEMFPTDSDGVRSIDEILAAQPQQQREQIPIPQISPQTPQLGQAPDMPTRPQGMLRQEQIDYLQQQESEGTLSESGRQILMGERALRESVGMGTDPILPVGEGQVQQAPEAAQQQAPVSDVQPIRQGRQITPFRGDTRSIEQAFTPEPKSEQGPIAILDEIAPPIDQPQVVAPTQEAPGTPAQAPGQAIAAQPEPTPVEPAPRTPQQMTSENIQQEMGLSAPEADATVALAEAMGLDMDSIQVVGEQQQQAVEFAEDGTALIRALTASNMGDSMSALAQVSRRRLLDRNIPPENRAGITASDIAVAEEWAGAQDGNWTPEAEAKFSRGFRRFLRDGDAFSHNTALATVFAKIRQFLSNVYKKIVGSEIGIKISPEMKRVYSRLVNRVELGKIKYVPRGDNPAVISYQNAEGKASNAIIDEVMFDQLPEEVQDSLRDAIDNVRIVGEVESLTGLDPSDVPMTEAELQEAQDQVDGRIPYTMLVIETEGEPTTATIAPTTPQELIDRFSHYRDQAQQEATPTPDQIKERLIREQQYDKLKKEDLKSLVARRGLKPKNNTVGALRDALREADEKDARQDSSYMSPEEWVNTVQNRTPSPVSLDQLNDFDLVFMDGSWYQVLVDPATESLMFFGPDIRQTSDMTYPRSEVWPELDPARNLELDPGAMDTGHDFRLSTTRQGGTQFIGDQVFTVEGQRASSFVQIYANGFTKQGEPEYQHARTAFQQQSNRIDDVVDVSAQESASMVRRFMEENPYLTPVEAIRSYQDTLEMAGREGGMAVQELLEDAVQDVVEPEPIPGRIEQPPARVQEQPGARQEAQPEATETQPQQPVEQPTENIMDRPVSERNVHQMLPEEFTERYGEPNDPKLEKLFKRERRKDRRVSDNTKIVTEKQIINAVGHSGLNQLFRESRQRAVTRFVIDQTGIEGQYFLTDFGENTRHRDIVSSALRAGKAVPPEVLSHYPETVKNYEEWRARHEATPVEQPTQQPQAEPAPQEAATEENLPQPTTLEELEALPQYTVYRTIRKDERKYAVRSDGPRGGGDTLHTTLADAEDTARRERIRDEQKAELLEREQGKRTEEQEAKQRREADDYSGFLTGKTAIQRGRIRKIMERQSRYAIFGGEVLSRREFIDRLYDAGELFISQEQEPKIKPMSRRQFNRADAEEQRAHQRRIDEAGTKTVYYVNDTNERLGVEMPKVAYEYAQHLLSQPTQQPQAEPAPVEQEQQRPTALPEPTPEEAGFVNYSDETYFLEPFDLRGFGNPSYVWDGEHVYKVRRIATNQNTDYGFSLTATRVKKDGNPPQSSTAKTYTINPKIGDEIWEARPRGGRLTDADTMRRKQGVTDRWGAERSRHQEIDFSALRESDGHVDFIGDYEFYRSPSGDLFMAEVTAPIDFETGRRTGKFIGWSESANKVLSHYRDNPPLFPWRKGQQQQPGGRQQGDIGPPEAREWRVSGPPRGTIKRHLVSSAEYHEALNVLRNLDFRNLYAMDPTAIMIRELSKVILWHYESGVIKLSELKQKFRESFTSYYVSKHGVPSDRVQKMFDKAWGRAVRQTAEPRRAIEDTRTAERKLAREANRQTLAHNRKEADRIRKRINSKVQISHRKGLLTRLTRALTLKGQEARERVFARLDKDIDRLSQDPAFYDPNTKEFVTSRKVQERQTQQRLERARNFNFRKGHRAGRIQVHDSVQDMMKFLKENFRDNPEVGREMTKLLRAAISRAPGKERDANLKSFVDRANSIIHQAEFRTMRKEVSDNYKRLRSKRRRTTRRHRKMFDAILETYDLSQPSNRTVDRALSVMNQLVMDDINETSSVLKSAIDWATEVQKRLGKTPIRDLSQTELQALNDLINMTIKMQDMYQAGVQDNWNGKMRRLVSRSVGILEQNPNRGIPGDVRHLANEIASGMADLDNIANYLFGEGSEPYNAIVEDARVNEIGSSYSLNRALDFLDSIKQQLNITATELARWSYNLSHNGRKSDTIQLRIDDQLYDITPGEMIKLYQYWNDPYARKQMENPRLSGMLSGPRLSRATGQHDHWLPAIQNPRHYAGLVRQMNEYDQRLIPFAEAMTRYYSETTWPELASAMEAYQGHSPIKQENYTPVTRRINDQFIDENMGAEGDPMSQGILKPRTGGISPMIVQDAITEFLSHSNRVSMAVNWGQYYRDIGALLNNQKVRQAIQRHTGLSETARQKIIENIMNGHSIVGDRPGEKGFFDRATRHLMRNVTTGALLGNINVITSIPFSLLSTQSEVDVRHLPEAKASAVSNASQIDQEIREHGPYLRAMKNNTGQQHLRPETQGYNSYNFFGVTPDTWMNRVVAKGYDAFRREHTEIPYGWDEVVGSPAQFMSRYVINTCWELGKARAMEQNPNLEVGSDIYWRDVNLEATKIFTRTQPNSSLVNTASWRLQARHNVFVASLMMFTGQTSVQMNQAIRAMLNYRNAKRHGVATPETMARMAKDVFLPTAGQSIMYNSLKMLTYGTLTGTPFLFASAIYRGRELPDTEDEENIRQAMYNFAWENAEMTAGNLLGVGMVAQEASEYYRRQFMGASRMPYSHISSTPIDATIEAVGGTSEAVYYSVLKLLSEQGDDRKWWEIMDRYMERAGVALGLPYRDYKRNSELLWTIGSMPFRED